ncbi:MAG: hypothetical protein KDA78_00150 [Planctomycetaceae bacterium]|nr:hypothetical protein [Planctomycetaceae bacterium]
MSLPPEPASSKENSPGETSPWVEAGRIISHVTTAIGVMLVCGWLGSQLDRLWNLQFFAFTGFAGGSVLGIWHLIRVVSAEEKPPQKD